MEYKINSPIKVIKSGEVPTSADIGPGDIAIGTITGDTAPHMYGNVDGQIVEFTDKSDILNVAMSAYNQANNAYNQANSANTTAIAATTAAGTAYTRANTAYSRANTAYNQANTSYNHANNAYNHANNAYNHANTAISAVMDPIQIGFNAVSNGRQSMAVGYNSKSTSSYTVALGYATNASGDSSIALGYQANTMGNLSMGLGYSASTSGASAVAIGQQANSGGDNSTALGYRATTSSSDKNVMQLGNSTNLSSLRSRVTLTVSSDERDKTDIVDMQRSLDFISRVRTIQYVNNHRLSYIPDDENLTEEDRDNMQKYGLCEYDREAHAQGIHKGERKRVGVSAQQTQEALVEIFGSADYADLVNDNLYDIPHYKEVLEGVECQLTVNYSGFVPFLIQAVQELSERVKALEAERDT